MDSIINSALAKHEKRMQQNFLFDRIRAISSETKRINANIELENKQVKSLYLSKHNKELYF